MSEDTIKALNMVVEYNDIHRFMEDERVDRALELVVKLMQAPDAVPPQKVSELIIELQSLSTNFAILANYYSGIGKDGADEIKKKNMYYTLKEAIGELTNALKYHARAGI